MEILYLFTVPYVEGSHAFVEAVIISIISLIAGGIISLVITVRFRSKSEISYQILSSAPVVQVSDEAKDDVEVLYKGERFNDVSVVVVRLWNSGNRPIRPSDIISPVTFTFKGSQILLTNRLAMMPPGWQDGMSGTREEVRLDNSLMNPKDSLTLKFLVAQYKGMDPPHARIADISAIKHVTDYSGFELFSDLLPMIVLVVSASMTIYAFVSRPFNTTTIELLWPLSSATLAAAFLVLIRRYRRRRRVPFLDFR